MTTSRSGSAASPPYVPVDCSLHDRYEAWAVRRTVLAVSWRHGSEVRQVENVRIADVRVADGAEYLVLSDDSRVRLDHLIAVTPSEPD